MSMCSSASRIRMAVLVGALASCVAVWPTTGSAQQKSIVDFSSGDTLILYSDPDGKNRAGEINKSDTNFPIALIDHDGDFGRIAARGGTYWVDLRRAKVRQASVAECGAGLSQSRLQVATAGARGASDACRKR